MIFALGVLVVVATGCSIVLGTLAAAAALVRSLRDERPPVPPSPACRPCGVPPEDANAVSGESCWWIDPEQLTDVRDVMVAYGVTTVIERAPLARRGLG